MMNRREAIQKTALAAGAIAVTSPLPAGALAQTVAPSGPFTLPPLPYGYDSLEPYIDTLTMRIHHDKHHAAYVANLNKAVAAEPGVAAMPVDELVRNISKVPEKIRAAVRNNAGGHYNHSLFWQMLRKGGGGKPPGEMGAALDLAFGDYEGFKAQFAEAAAKQFGSGWAWLVIGNRKELSILSTPNQDNPITEGKFPLLGLDVWEHAYYLKYQNRRADYIAGFFSLIDWDFVGNRFHNHG